MTAAQHCETQNPRSSYASMAPNTHLQLRKTGHVADALRNSVSELRNSEFPSVVVCSPVRPGYSFRNSRWRVNYVIISCQQFRGSAE